MRSPNRPARARARSLPGGVRPGGRHRLMLSLRALDRDSRTSRRIHVIVAGILRERLPTRVKRHPSTLAVGATTCGEIETLIPKWNRGHRHNIAHEPARPRSLAVRSRLERWATMPNEFGELRTVADQASRPRPGSGHRHGAVAHHQIGTAAGSSSSSRSSSPRCARREGSDLYEPTAVHGRFRRRPLTCPGDMLVLGVGRKIAHHPHSGASSNSLKRLDPRLCSIW